MEDGDWVYDDLDVALVEDDSATVRGDVEDDDALDILERVASPAVPSTDMSNGLVSALGECLRVRRYSTAHGISPLCRHPRPLMTPCAASSCIPCGLQVVGFLSSTALKMF